MFVKTLKVACISDQYRQSTVHLYMNASKTYVPLPVIFMFRWLLMGL